MSVLHCHSGVLGIFDLRVCASPLVACASDCVLSVCVFVTVCDECFSRSKLLKGEQSQTLFPHCSDIKSLVLSDKQ